MRGTRNSWLWVSTAVILVAVAAASLVGSTRPDPRMPGWHPAGLRYRVECWLERQGIIPFSPFRHVVD